MNDYDDVKHLDAPNDAALSLDGIIRLLEALANHDDANRGESLALIVVTERMQIIADSLHEEARIVDCKIINSV